MELKDACTGAVVSTGQEGTGLICLCSETLENSEVWLTCFLSMQDRRIGLGKREPILYR